ncbi:MAG: adenylosuccinate synthase [Acidobacteriota bacterium]
MGNVVIIGAQWGDEGKGKVVDLLCERVDMVVRFQGGPNAGHTVSVAGKKTFLHHIPTGVLHPDCTCILGNGMVIDPEGFLEEIEGLASSGVACQGRLFVSDRAQWILPHHRALDRALETEGALKIGTTRKGVGYAYQSKASRVGLRACDVSPGADLDHRLGLSLRGYEAWRRHLPDLPEFTVEEMRDAVLGFSRGLAPYVDDTVERVHMTLAAGRPVLFEGSQGTLLDMDHGTYPFVTSSSTVAGAACAGAGVGPGQIDGVLGVFKAYATRVGEGPMPTEETGPAGEALRQRGHEFGTTTGRPRRCGWFDAVAGRHAAQVNGLQVGALMLLDVLDEFASIQICVAHETSSGRVSRLAASPVDLAASRPVYETVPGWRSGTRGCRTWEELPDAARGYVRRLEALVGVRFVLISVGPDRSQTIVRDPAALDALFR